MGLVAKGYWIAHNQVKDAAAYEAYKIAAAPALRAYGAQFLVRAGRRKTPKGTLHPRTIVIEFPSYQAAQDCYSSAEYQLAKKIRLPLANSDLTIVEGYDT
tara:strand:+ start:474 stop:776 length:303 start_codon:yes stop_codon:yes gene_type:complete